MTEETLLASFEDCTLPKESFHHADHVKMAFLYLCRYPALEALQRFSNSLSKYSLAKGTPGRYNETVTWAYFFLIRERISRARARQTWLEFAVANEDLLDWKQNILNKYYREETLASELAKGTFLFPDKSSSGI